MTLRHFERAGEAYVLAMSDGALDLDECDAILDGFARAQQGDDTTHDIRRLSAFNEAVVKASCGRQDEAAARYERLVGEHRLRGIESLSACNNLFLLVERGRGPLDACFSPERLRELFHELRAGYRPDTARLLLGNAVGLLLARFVEAGDEAAFDLALESSQWILAVDAGDPLNYARAARVYYTRGRRERSYLVLADIAIAQAFRVAEAAGHTPAELHALQGLLWLERQDQTRAMEAFRSAVAVEEHHFVANMGLGVHALRLRDFAGAADLFAAAREGARGTEAGEAELALGVARRGLGDLKGAEECYRRARLPAGHPGPHYNLGILYQDHLATRRGLAATEVRRLNGLARRALATALGKLRRCNPLLCGLDWSRALRATEERIARIDEILAPNKRPRSTATAGEREGSRGSSHSIRGALASTDSGGPGRATE
ncbi:MAG: hypothetical protein R3B09_28810 [Nannocystaceae bacterium]